MNETINDTEIVDCSLNPHEFLEVKFFLISVVGSIIGLLGLFGNASTALILTRPSMRNPNNLFLTALAVFDSCLIITAFCIYAMEYIIEYTRAFNLYVAWLTYLRFAFALSHISQTGSVYITVAVTIERYLAVCRPRKSRLFCGSSNDKPRLFRREKLAELYITTIINVSESYLSADSKHIVTGRNELKEKSREATLVLVIIVCIFLGCNFWGFVLTLLERIIGQEKLMHDHHVFYTFSREAINFLAIINSSINFVIYLIFGKDFRKELIVVYGCGVRGITMKLPVHDKFSLWRNWTIKKRAAVRKSIGVTARDWRHKFSLSSNLDRSQADSLENARFLSNDPSLYAGGKGCQFAQSPIKALQQQQPDQVEKIHGAYAQANGNHHTTSPRPVFIRRAPTYALYSQSEHLLTNGTNGSSSVFPSNFTENGTII
ncbi:hypothetical protein WR25_15372 [Diploscapter pachys]|uniref:G-protein coupled receptors family 1 profile domain-containing protein n=1 Tax=Diploscapter pachys TaxID=2018661 RepID=A0A2A2L698_9BILA|nr:hypothetical protein WR25_15372 [Diploscapter pachys]